jgi:hypothetical protein
MSYKCSASYLCTIESFLRCHNHRLCQVSFIIPMHDHVSITLECLLNLLRFADEIPSAEYVLVDDGSLEVRSFIAR